MTLPEHICFTCADLCVSCAMMSGPDKKPHLIADCLHYCGKNAGERKTCKLYNKADDKRIQDRKNMLEDMKRRWES